MLSQIISTFGLDRAGKTVILNYFTTGVIMTNLRPTLAINYSHLMLVDLAVRFADLPGQKSLRKIWLSNLKQAQVLVFVLDTADYLRFEEAKAELVKVLKTPELKTTPLVFIYHKMDLPEAKENLEFAKTFFKCEELKGRGVFYFETTIQSKESLNAVKSKIYAIVKSVFAL
jgi:small GTP-binding protein